MKTPAPGLLPWQVCLLAAASGAWAVHDPLSAVLACLLVVAGCVLAGRVSVWFLVSLFVASLAGFLYAQARLPVLAPTPSWMDERAKGVLHGEVAQVTERPGDRLEIILEGVSYHLAGGGEEALPGLLVLTWQEPAFRPTVRSRVAVAVTPHPVGGFDNPGGEDWGWRARLRGVTFRAFSRGGGRVSVESEAPLTAAQALRDRIREAILHGAGHDSAGGMVLGLVTGERFAVHHDDRERVRRASLSHLLAVSGMNLAPVVAVGWGLAWFIGFLWPPVYLRIPRPKLAVLIGFPLTVAYLWLGRFELSLVRAWLMFAAWGVLLTLGRPRVLLDGLCIAVAVLFLWQPLWIFDVGLQLSVAAVAGLALLFPLAQPLFMCLRGPGFWRRALIFPVGWLVATLVCQLAILPVQLTVFGEASPHLYLNLLWLPVVEWLAQPLADLGAVLAAWRPALGDPLLGAAAFICERMFASLRFMEAHGWLGAYAVQRPWQPETLGYFLLLGGFIWVRSMTKMRRVLWLLLCAVLLFGPPLWRAWDESRDRVRLSMLDVGQGQALVIEARGGKRWLVDSGGSLSETFDLGQAVLAPALTWGRPPELSGAVMSHEDRDHTGGFVYLLRAFRLGFLAGNGALPKERDFGEALAASRLTPEVWRAGQRVELTDGLAFEVLSPARESTAHGNNASLILRLVWRGHGLAILPGDAGKPPLNALAASETSLGADILVAPHHGSGSSLSPGFYQKVGAKWVFISCGRENSYGFPASSVMDALRRLDVETFSTAFQGAVTATWESPQSGPVFRTMK